MELSAWGDEFEKLVFRMNTPRFVPASSSAKFQGQVLVLVPDLLLLLPFRIRQETESPVT